MTTNEKLAQGGGDSNLNPSLYTHIVSVVNISSLFGNSYGFSGSNGNIEPKTVTVNSVSLTIGSLNSYSGRESTKFSFSSQVTTSGLLYIRRYDTQLKIGVQLRENTELYTFADKLFSESDVGKDIPIWFSTTPPPWKGDDDHSGGEIG